MESTMWPFMVWCVVHFQDTYLGLYINIALEIQLPIAYLSTISNINLKMWRIPTGAT